MSDLIIASSPSGDGVRPFQPRVSGAVDPALRRRSSPPRLQVLLPVHLARRRHAVVWRVGDRRGGGVAGFSLRLRLARRPEPERQPDHERWSPAHLPPRRSHAGMDGSCTANEFFAGNSQSGCEPGSGTTRMSASRPARPSAHRGEGERTPRDGRDSDTQSHEPTA